MSGSGGAGVSIARARGENRFYNPPAIRQRQLEEQKRQQQQQQNSAAAAAESKVSPASSAESDKRTATAAAEDCASSFCSVSARGDGSNLDRFLEYTTPLVSAQYFPKVIEKV